MAAAQELEVLFTTKKVGELFSVTTETVRNWIEKGELRAVLIQGRYRIPKSEVVKLGNSKFGD
jgi:excisionase family DNA binding protein